MTTIADIVRETGLARTTVAEILRDKPGYNDKTRKRVQQAAKRLNYRPNFLSKALSGGKSMTVGVLSASLETETTNNRLFAIESAAQQAGYLAYLTGWGDHEGRGMKQYLQDLLDRRVDGLIIHREVPFERDVEATLAQLSIPVVYLDTPPNDGDLAVHLTRSKAIETLAVYLASLGHRRAAFVLSPYHFHHPQRRADLIRQACLQTGITLEPLTDWMIPAGHYDARQISEIYYNMFRAKSLPTALLVSNDSFALAAIHALRKLGLTVPKDISVVGFDDLPFSSLVDPAITTVRQPGAEMGRRAFELLLEKMNHPDKQIASDAFGCELIIRESTGPATTK